MKCKHCKCKWCEKRIDLKVDFIDWLLFQKIDREYATCNSCKAYIKSLEDLRIKKYEYVIDTEHPSSKDYEVYYKGKLLRDVRGIIRIGGYEDFLQLTSHNKD